MAGYKPLYIRGNKGGLVQSREEFILPDDAYPVLENAYVRRERIKRKQGYTLLGRLKRDFIQIYNGPAQNGTASGNYLVYNSYISNITKANPAIITTFGKHHLVNGNAVAISKVLGMTQINETAELFTVIDDYNFSYNIDSTAFSNYISGGIVFSSSTVKTPTEQPNAQIVPGSFIVSIPSVNITIDDQGDGTGISLTPGNSFTINYLTGQVETTTTAPNGSSLFATYSYWPALPVMGLRSRELNSINDEATITFDTVYVYRFGSNGWQEFVPGQTWTGTDSDFFWSTNYWVDASNNRLFWVTNDSGVLGDPIRYTNGTVWNDFAPIIDVGTGTKLQQCLAMLPFRGRLMAFNTLEGTTLPLSVSYSQRIRWAKIGSPLTTTAWYDTPGNGGFLDIPTSQSIVCVGFVRDNLIIYCERSTWQLRYTGQTIAPFQIEKVNSELGVESTFSAVQFDTSLVGIGDKGVVECDSYESRLIDIKIPDLVFSFNNDNEGPQRIQGARNFFLRLAYWIYPFVPSGGRPVTYPNRRLVYNYENDSWAIFTDSLTALGSYQPQQSRRWSSQPSISWRNANFPWINRQKLTPTIVGGNQQGFVFILDQQVTNGVSLSILDITGNTTTPTSIESPSHNLDTNYVIKISDIPEGTPFASSLNGNIFGVTVVDEDNFLLQIYDPSTGGFDLPQLDVPASYIGGGQIAVRDNFNISSKKFNFQEEGQNIQLGSIDLLMNSTDSGAITVKIYADYNDNEATNVLPQNINPTTSEPDTFFNSIIDTSSSGGLKGSKNLQKVYCPTRAAFLTIQYTLSNAQMIGPEQESDVQIDSQVLWMRPAGRLQTSGF